MKILKIKISQQESYGSDWTFIRNRVFRIYKNTAPMDDTCTYIRTGDNKEEDNFTENEKVFDYKGGFGTPDQVKFNIIKDIEDNGYKVEVIEWNDFEIIEQN